MKQRLRIIVSGLIAQYPMGGVTWDYFQYVLGLHRLGHEVYYLEDTGFWPYNPVDNQLSQTGCQYNIDYTKKVFEQYGLGDRWMFKFTRNTNDHVWYGLPDHQRKAVLESADLLINVSGCLYMPSDYKTSGKLIYIDSDPVFTQVKLALGFETFESQIAAHDRHFTFAENPMHKMPATAFDWYPTRQPVVLSEWRSDNASRNVFTTVMNWTSYEALQLDGVNYGQKDEEFKAYQKLPAALHAANIDTKLELAVNKGKTSTTPYQKLLNDGWALENPAKTCSNMNSYRQYIQSSRAEWSVAKQGYVNGDSGWFSCRSACYLASGRPVVVQDTGFSRLLQCGAGLHAFSTIHQAMDAIEQVLTRYKREQADAVEIASAYFDSTIVLNRLLEDIFAQSPRNQPVAVANLAQMEQYHVNHAA